MTFLAIDVLHEIVDHDTDEVIENPCNMYDVLYTSVTQHIDGGIIFHHRVRRFGPEGVQR